MRLSDLQCGDEVLVRLDKYRWPFPAKVEAMPSGSVALQVRRVMNQITGRLATKVSYVSPKDIVELRRRNGVPVTKGARKW
jgi:hypothetical protein